MPETGEDLRAAALAALDGTDTTPLLVYADWLTGQGDPRGEFIALQVRGDAGAALAKAHGQAWLGTADAMLSGVVWHWGFPRAAKLTYAIEGEPEALRTLRTLTVGRGDRHHRAQVSRLLTGGLLDGLTTLHGPIEIETWITLLERGTRLQAVELPRAVLGTERNWTPELRAAMNLENDTLRELVSTQQTHPRVWRRVLRDTRVGREIRAIRTQSTVPSLRAWLAGHPELDLDLTLNRVLNLTRRGRELVAVAKLGRVYQDRRSDSMAAVLTDTLRGVAKDALDTVLVRWPAAYTPTKDDQAALDLEIARVQKD